MTSLAERVRGLRLARGLRLIDVSASAGLSFSYVGDVEHGRHIPRVDALNAIANAFGMSLVELLSEVEPYKDPPRS